MDLAFITPHKVGYVEVEGDGLETTLRCNNRTQAAVFPIGVIGRIQAGVVGERHGVNHRAAGIGAFLVLFVEDVPAEFCVDHWPRISP